MQRQFLRMLSVFVLPCVIGLWPSRSALGGVGGGFTDGGLNGLYFSNPTAAGSPSFGRKDIRLDFSPGNVAPPAGVGQTGEPGFSAVGATNWSVVWTGRIVPRFSETYTFKSLADDGVVLKVKPAGAGVWTTVLSQSSPTGADAVGTYGPMTAGAAYDVEVDFVQTAGTWGLNLRWASPSTPEEVIDPLQNVGLNNPDTTTAFADLVNGGRNNWQNAAMDSNGWPTGDGQYVFQESLNQGLDIDPLMRGTVTFRFHGKATVGVQGNCGNVQYSYDAVSNTTLGTFQTFNNHWNASYFNFSNSHRDGQPNGPGGLTDLKMMRPVAPDATASYDPAGVFTQPIRDAMSHFSTLRFQYVANQQKEWSDRTLPSFFNQAGGSSASPYYGNGGASSNGMAWEYKVMLCNETGRDLMISIPTVASGRAPTDVSSYIVNLANLLKYGSDGVNPYTSAQANPVFAPLNPNLRVYLELENELWNYGGPFYVDWSNINSLVQADQAANSPDFQALNYDNVNDPNIWHLRKIIQRLIQISSIFRAVYGDSGMMSHVRPLYEWQYDNINNTAQNPLTFADLYYNNGDGQMHVAAPHPLNYYLWGGGGATYYGAVNGSGLTTLLNDSAFAGPALPAPGYSPAPAGGPWTFTGTAGIAQDGGSGDDIPPPFSGNQVGYITDRGSASINVTFPANPTSNIYGVSFKAVNRTQNGATGADKENVRVYLDDTTDITAKTFNQGNGDTPIAYDPNNPWKAFNVFWTLSDYYYTRSFTVAPGSTHKITIKGMGDITNAAANQTAFLGDVRVTSVDKIFADGIPGGGEAAGQPAGQNYAHTIQVETDWAKAFGLEMLAYEGGWSLGGDDGGSWVQIEAKYGDPRAKDAQTHSLDLFYSAGAAVSVLGTYAQWPSWSDYYAQQGLLDVSRYPIVQGVDDRNDQLPVEANNGASLPATLLPRNATLAWNAGASGGQINAAGGWLDWNVIAPFTGAFTPAVSATGSYLLLADDAVTVTPGSSLVLTKGLHTFKIKSVGGSVTVSSLSVSVPGAPAAPTLLSAADGDASARLTWTPVSGATGYEVKYGTASGSYTVALDAGAATGLTVSGLLNNQTYYCVVSAINAGGPSLPSNERVVVPLADNQLGTLAAWNFAGYAGSEPSAAPASATSRATVSPLARGGGLKPTGYHFLNTFGSEAAGNVYAQNLTDSIAASQYYQFSLAPVSGKKLALRTLTFLPFFQNVRGGSSDPRGAGITYSVDAGTSFSGGIVGSGTPTSSTNGSPFTVDLSREASLQNATGTVVFRVYLYGNGAYEFTGIGGGGQNGTILSGSFAATALPPAQTTLTATPVSGSPGQSVTLAAVLKKTSNGTALAGKTLTFKVDGQVVGTAGTQASGTARLPYAIPANATPGSHTLSVSFAGDSAYSAASGTGTLTVKASATVTVTPVSGTRGATVTLAAVLKKTSDNTALAGKTLTFSVDGQVVGTAGTQASGTARFSYAVPATASPGGHSITAAFAGDNSFTAASGAGTLTVH